jgi:hypothetical protein
MNTNTSDFGHLDCGVLYLMEEEGPALIFLVRFMVDKYDTKLN